MSKTSRIEPVLKATADKIFAPNSPIAAATSINAEAIVEPIGLGAVPTLAKFDPPQFAGITVNGLPIGDYATYLSTITRGTTTLATTGALNGRRVLRHQAALPTGP